MKYEKIIDILSQNKYDFLIDEPLKIHTSIKIGGNAKIFVYVKSEKEFLKLINILKNNDIKYHIIGAGTNTLAGDNGFDGIVISTKRLKRYKISKNKIYIQCGTNLFAFGKILKKHGLKGLEFAYGIPGSVGGAVVMNAGAYEHNIGDFVEYVKVIENGKIKKIKKDDMQFSYRSSLAQTKNLIVLGAKFVFEIGKPGDIEKLQNEYFQKRLNSQPYTELSFGSVFKKNLKFEPISKLIDRLGLKGFRIGGAEISKKHAGFIVNVANATCQDCLLLIKYIQEKVFENFGFVPELEVKLLGV